MLRSLYSGISGLKVHQTAMDVIGNNISNVNTIAFKSSKVNFSDVLYQTTQSATGASNLNGTAGTNAMQIGLGSTVAGISADITTQGGAQRTDNALDLMINGDAFFVVSTGGTNYFTKNGAFTIDEAGNLATETGALVMGWQIDPDNANNIIQSEVSALRISTYENSYTEPEATNNTYFSGNIDQNDVDFEKGKTIQMEFYDSLGNMYTAQYKLTQNDTTDKNVYSVSLANIVDSSGNSLFLEKSEANGITTYSAKVPQPQITLDGNTYTLGSVDAQTGELVLNGTAASLTYNASSGKFVGVGAAGEGSIKLSISTGQTGATSSENLFEPIDINFESTTMFEDGGNSSIISNRGDKDTGMGAGATVGTMKGVSISTEGKIYGTYDNNTTKLLGQIAVASFTNPAGLEAVGDSMYQTTQNSGAFDGIGSDIGGIGLSFSTGVLEMSNVDLASEFTSMITTQRGFQANSKIITTSDTLLEELINLKR